MAKKFKKTNSKIAEKQTRKYLFEMIYDAVDRIHDNMSYSGVDALTTADVSFIASVLSPLAEHIDERLNALAAEQLAEDPYVPTPKQKTSRKRKTTAGRKG